ncbi:alpha/beta fold hydrolase [Nitrospirillum sp. BR 11752]|uniref:alpha/beta hydrolase family protein n=1 Tax=Nitrospirillum sp. BR 11752 TaxID=3104293 RepID=UPI002EB2C7EC|nr:alpha/beta fold hydrolase [Nitrospirillum sp. BR 11752]
MKELARVRRRAVFQMMALWMAVGVGALWVGTPQAHPDGPTLPQTGRPTPPALLTGDWQGTLDTGATRLRLVFHVAAAGQGVGQGSTSLSATLDSVDQQVTGVPIPSVTSDGDQVSFTIPSILGGYTGALTADGQSLRGTWTQAGQARPLTLARVTTAQLWAEQARPQTPRPPFPYRAVDVAYDNPRAPGVRLAGTLTLPLGKGPFPAALLITGSGPQDRDETIDGHKPFLVLADALARRGIAVLRVDDRGVGRSTGDFDAATTPDFATDAAAGVAYLRTRADIDPARIGLIGHSEGGLIAPMVADRDPAIAWLVLMAGPGVDGEHILLTQKRLIAGATGVGPSGAERLVDMDRREYAIVKQETDAERARARLRILLQGGIIGGDNHVATSEALIEAVTKPWYRWFLTYDPAPTLRTLRLPVLALVGSKDLQVSAAENLPALRAALASDPQAEVREVPGLNHMFQTADTGAPTEYARIPQTIAPMALDLITDWVAAHSGHPEP